MLKRTLIWTLIFYTSLEPASPCTHHDLKVTSVQNYCRSNVNRFFKLAQWSIGTISSIMLRRQPPLLRPNYLGTSAEDFPDITKITNICQWHWSSSSPTQIKEAPLCHSESHHKTNQMCFLHRICQMYKIGCSTIPKLTHSIHVNLTQLNGVDFILKSDHLCPEVLL